MALAAKAAPRIARTKRPPVKKVTTRNRAASRLLPVCKMGSTVSTGAGDDRSNSERPLCIEVIVRVLNREAALMFHAHGSNPKPVNRFSAGRPRCLSGRACSRPSFISPILRIRRWCRRSRPTARRVRADQEASAPKTRILPEFFSPRRNIRPMFWLDLTNSWENIAVQPKRSSTRWRTWKSPPSCDQPPSISSTTSAW